MSQADNDRLFRGIEACYEARLWLAAQFAQMAQPSSTFAPSIWDKAGFGSDVLSGLETARNILAGQLLTAQMEAGNEALPSVASGALVSTAATKVSSCCS